MMGSEAPPLMKMCLPLILTFAPRFIHPSPYKGNQVGVVGIPIDFSLMPLVRLNNMPKGDYRVVFEVFFNKLFKLKLVFRT